MQFTTSLLGALALAGSAIAQGRPSNTSICDYYTTALLTNNTAENQLKVLTLLVNTAVIGNYTKPTIPNVTFPDVMVPGILNNGTVNGTAVNLLPYFNGGLASTNRGGMATSVNFLDDGGAAPLMMNMPANGTTSNQYFLLTHLYQFFGTALGCSQQGMSGYPKYGGDVSMYDVHKFMNLNYIENTWFIQNVGLSAMSFGVSMDDVQAVAKTLGGAFNVKCAPTSGPLESLLGPELQSICIAADCPLAPNATCDAYGPAYAPGIANSTLAMGEGNTSSTATMTAPNGGHISPTASSSGAGGASSSPAATGAAATMVAGSVAAGLAGLAALVL